MPVIDMKPRECGAFFRVQGGQGTQLAAAVIAQ
jgi:hypothetical protein